MNRLTLVLLVALAAFPVRGQAAPAADAARAVAVARGGLQDTVAFVGALARQTAGDELLSRHHKERLWGAWQRFLDYQVALDAVRTRHGRDAGDEAFWVHRAAFLAQYRFALGFVTAAEPIAQIDAVLNEPVPELGLPERTYAGLKYRFLHLARAAEFAAVEAAATLRGAGPPELARGAGEDATAIWAAGRGRGEALTVENGARMVRDALSRAWLPVQAGVAGWMGDVKVHRPEVTLIDPARAGALASRLRPGDVLLERREWYLSNLGLPGFWTHAALYVGTPDERAALGRDPEVGAWVRAQGFDALEELLRARNPDGYRASLAPDARGHEPRVLEAIGEGVTFTTLEHSGAADSLAALRPRRPPVGVARALAVAFGYAGRPYDFEFDFATDASLVCSELVYKAYEPAPGFGGLELPLAEVLGRKVLPPNDLARLVDAQAGATDRAFDLVVFLDGHEGAGTAVESTGAAFRASWRRPKWHVLVQGSPAAAERKQ